jgi:1,4-dihydroxy-2-naphthoate octaprenyltransferase
LLYIIASRAYSYRKIRLKRFPIPGFLTVFVFQGALIYFITYHAVHTTQTLNVPLLPCVIASLLIGALYPLSQVYQHKEDKADGVESISYLLGKRGTFMFSMLLFLLATGLMYYFFNEQQRSNQFILYVLIMFPVVSFFLYWMVMVWKNDNEANFKNSLRMNALSTFSTTIFFIVILIQNH